MNRFNFLTMLILALLATFVSRADDATDKAYEERRQQAITDYTQRMRDANYPALFEKAAKEFNVPADVLKAVAFAETRWTHLQWPVGETASPENGMPRAYGIMSLWDNDYFGHTLQEAAKLTGQTPETLKSDVYQNIRGGAALLRELYDKTPRPADAPLESQIESWRKAVAKYTGIPQPELSEAHALRVYEYMNQGYHQYGIEWDGQRVNLGPMREEVAKIKEEAQTRKLALNAGVTNLNTGLTASSNSSPTGNNSPGKVATNSTVSLLAHEMEPNGLQKSRFVQRKILIGFMLLLIGIGVVYLLRQRRK